MYDLAALEDMRRICQTWGLNGSPEERLYIRTDHSLDIRWSWAVQIDSQSTPDDLESGSCLPVR